MQRSYLALAALAGAAHATQYIHTLTQVASGLAANIGMDSNTTIENIYAQLGHHDPDKEYCADAHNRVKDQSLNFYAIQKGSLEF